MPINVDEIKKSYGRCLLANGKETAFLEYFYKVFLESDPEIQRKFANTDFERQTEALQHGISMAIMYAERHDAAAERILGGIRSTHGEKGLDILESHYRLWIDALLKAVAEYDNQSTPELIENWRELSQLTVDYMLGKTSH